MKSRCGIMDGRFRSRRAGRLPRWGAAECAADGGLVPPGPPLQVIECRRAESGQPALGQSSLRRFCPEFRQPVGPPLLDRFLAVVTASPGAGWGASDEAVRGLNDRDVCPGRGTGFAASPSTGQDSCARTSRLRYRPASMRRCARAPTGKPMPGPWRAARSVPASPLPGSPHRRRGDAGARSRAWGLARAPPTASTARASTAANVRVGLVRPESGPGVQRVPGFGCAWAGELLPPLHPEGPAADKESLAILRDERNPGKRG